MVLHYVRYLTLDSGVVPNVLINKWQNENYYWNQLTYMALVVTTESGRRSARG